MIDCSISQWTNIRLVWIDVANEHRWQNYCSIFDLNFSKCFQLKSEMFDKDDEIGEWNIFDCSIIFSNLLELFSFSCDNRDEFCLFDFESMNYRSTFVLDFELKNLKFHRWKFLVRKSFSKKYENELFQFLIKFIWNTFKSIRSSI